MTTLPLIKIVTPSFNQAQFLEETIQSVMRQDYPRIEHIVIDGGSIDGSVDIIKKYENHIAYWVSERDAGQSSAINKGFLKATGDIFGWLNSDDLLAPSATKIASYYLMRYPDIGVVYGDRLYIDAKGNVTGINQCPSYKQGMFKKNFTLPQETVFFRKEVFEKVGGLDESLHFAMDFDLWCKLSKVTRMRHIPLFIGYFRAHETAKSVVVHRTEENGSAKYLEEHGRVYKRHFGTPPPSPMKMKWYRMLRRLNLLIEQRSDGYREEVLNIRSVISEHQENIHTSTK
ncbi:MAG TPA: glycosyltransferase family 2 protein [Syntrophorhabdales bacterium]|nr:glycosyltransferase family 2 protein [Syntrophorhabdales bacterium]